MNYNNLQLDKGMYHVSGKSFTQVLENLDNSQNYRGTPLENLDAYQRQLKRFDIKVSGRDSSAVDKFFATANSAALFPEYVGRAIKQGIEEVDLIPEITATTTLINGLDYRSVASVPSEADKELTVVSEGDIIPTTEVKTQENLVTLKKRGRMLVASYEALRFQKLDLFTVTLKQIGAYIAKTQLKDAIDVLINGDGNSNPADSVNAATTGTITYTDLLTLWSKFDLYQMNTLLVPQNVMQQLLSIAEFQNPLTGLNFQGTGKLSTPLGANLFKTTAMPDSTMIGLDKNCALEKAVAQEISLEYDKLIDRQLERAAVTTIVGFAKIFEDASVVLKV